MYSIKGHIIRLLYLCPFHFFFTVLILLNILYSYLLSGKIKKYKNTKIQSFIADKHVTLSMSFHRNLKINRFSSWITPLGVGQFQYLKTVKLKISHGRKSQLVVSCQVVTNPWCGLAVIFCSFILHLVCRKTINIPKIFSGVHDFTGKTVSCNKL